MNPIELYKAMKEKKKKKTTTISAVTRIKSWKLNLKKQASFALPDSWKIKQN